MSKGPWNKPICRCGRCRKCRNREACAEYRERKRESQLEVRRELERIDAVLRQESEAA